MIALEFNELKILTPEAHEEARTSVSFQRTLRVPDTDKSFPLPPGLGRFPLRHIDDFGARIPESWARRGGVVLPMYQAEAMWISFGNYRSVDYPFAVKVGTGKVNAVSGKPWSPELSGDPQDYVVLPGQPWLDGYASEEGIIRQFVAMPLGSGLSVEQHLSGKEEHGGLQILVYPMKSERYRLLLAERAKHSEERAYDSDFAIHSCLQAAPMGLAAGGRIRQEVYRDEFGVDAWDVEHARRCFVTIVNSETWTELTGEAVPTKPVSAEDYARAGLPWFDHYNEKLEPLSGSTSFGDLPALPDTKPLKDENGGLDPTRVPVVSVGRSRRPSARRVTEGPF